MAKITAVLVGTLLAFVLAFATLPSSFNPVINWLGPDLGVSFQALLALLFVTFGSPLTYSTVFMVWAIVGIVVGVCARGLRPAFSSASLVYTFTYALMGLFFLSTFLSLSKSGLLHATSLPVAPPGTNTATLLNTPIFSQFVPLFLGGISSATSGSVNALSSFNTSSLLTSLIPSLIGSGVILFVFALIVGFFMGRVTKMLKPSSKRTAGTPSATPVPVSAKVAAIVIMAVILLSGGLFTVSSSATSSPNFYAESVISVVNPDGSATNYYTFLSNSFLSNVQSSMGSNLVAALIASQAGNLGFLPSAIQSQISKYANLVAPTVSVIVYSGSCSSSITKEGSTASKALGSAFGIPNLQFLLDVPSTGSEIGLPSLGNLCVLLYQSSNSLSSVAPTFEIEGSAMSSTGLMMIFQDALSSGFLVPGQTASSVNSSALYAGLIEGQFISYIPVDGNVLSNVASSEGLIGIIGGIGQQNSVLHSSSNQHTASFSQLTQYSGLLSFANDSSFSVAGVAVPLSSYNQTSSIPNLSNFNYTMVTTNATLLKQVVGEGQTILSLLPGNSIASQTIQAIFSKLLPAYLSVTKTLTHNSDGTLTVQVTVINKDTDSLSNLVMDDTAFPNAYALQVVKGSDLNNSVKTLAPQQSVTYTYDVKPNGIGVYSSNQAILSYDLNGTQFSTFSNIAYYNATKPTAATALGSLTNSVGSILDQYAGMGSSGPALVIAIFVALFALAGFMEFRSFRKWSQGK